MNVTAVAGSVDEGPQSPRLLGLLGISAQQPRPDAEEDAAAEPQPFCLGIAPWKWFEQLQPPILQFRQLLPGDASRQQLARNRLQPRLGRWRPCIVQFLESLPPPRHADRAKPSVAAGGNDVGQGKIEVPECSKRRSNGPRQLLEGNLPVGVEPALSDR